MGQAALVMVMGVAEQGFDLPDVVLDPLVLVGAGLVVAVAEVGERASGLASRCQMMTRMERATATWALALPRRRTMRE
jgi:hypothetical protein